MSLSRWALVVRRPHAQNAPPSPDSAWHTKAEKGLDRELKSHPDAKYDIDPRRPYTLAELIDLAQHHNPETRVAFGASDGESCVTGGGA